jgi:hypothetical protein
MRGRELIEPVHVVRDGAVNSAAIGWSRRPLHTVQLPGNRARHKRWEHWALMNEELLFLVTLAGIGPLSFVIVAHCDLRTRVWSEKVRVVRAQFPDCVHGDIHVSGMTLSETRLVIPGVADLAIEPARDTLNVVVPFTRGFAFTSKQVGMRAQGRIHGRPFVGLATLDHGRGIWPWRTRWNWACAANETIAFNLGARWTDGSGTNENGYFLNGTLYPIPADVRFAFDRKRPDVPVGITGDDVDLLFTPIARKRARIELGLVAADLDFRVGRFMGRVGGVEITNMLGWCEAFDAKC